MYLFKQFFYALLVLGLLHNPALARAPDESYTRIRPAQPTESGDKIEVVEIFWYGCSHCFVFEPHVRAWQQTMPDDVVFRQVPGVLNKNWAIHARAFFAAQSMGALDKLHKPLFEALHVARRELFSRASLLDFADEVGIDEVEFKRRYDSNETEVKLKQAYLLARNARITGVPSLIVNGKYLVTASTAGSFEDMMATVDRLIELERNDR